MEYRVVVTPEAQAAIDRDIAHVRREASREVADAWYCGLIEAIASLSVIPMRCAVIPEHGLFEEEIRQLLYGRRPHLRRIMFFIDGDAVYVVRYQHSRMPLLNDAGDLGLLRPPAD